MPSGGLREARVTVDGGRIAAVELGGPGDRDAIIVPGFVDLQVNGFGGHDLRDGPVAIAPVAELLPRTGVTGFLPTPISRPVPERLRLVQAAAQHAGGRAA